MSKSRKPKVVISKEREQLYRLIIGQIKHDGFETAAAQLMEIVPEAVNIDASDRLNHLVTVVQEAKSLFKTVLCAASSPVVPRKRTSKAAKNDDPSSDEEFASEISKSKRAAKSPAKKNAVKKSTPKPAKTKSPVKRRVSIEFSSLSDNDDDDDETVDDKKPLVSKRTRGKKNSSVPKRTTRKKAVQTKYFSGSEEGSDKSAESDWTMSDE